MNRMDRLALRREAKFEKHDIEIKEEDHVETRTFGRGESAYDQTFHFKHAVYVKGRLEGRARTPRSALKRAHQAAKNRTQR